MDKLNHELQLYIKNKIDYLTKVKKTTYLLNTITRLGVIILNLIIIALAMVVIVMQVNWYENELKPAGQAFSLGDFLNVAGLTVVLATFIVLTFLINVALSIYSVVMKFSDYKKALREIEYITIKLEEDNANYSVTQFENDLEEIKKIYLVKKKITRKEMLMKFIMGGK